MLHKRILKADDVSIVLVLYNPVKRKRRSPRYPVQFFHIAFGRWEATIFFFFPFDECLNFIFCSSDFSSDNTCIFCIFLLRNLVNVTCILITQIKFPHEYHQESNIAGMFCKKLIGAYCRENCRIFRNLSNVSLQHLMLGLVLLLMIFFRGDHNR